jgi:hypothetical protein
MKYLAKLALILLVTLAFCPLPALAHTEAVPFVTDLTADGGTCFFNGVYYSEEDCPAEAEYRWGVDVGDVQVWNDGTNVNVTYVLDPAPNDPLEIGDWCMTKTHLDAQLDWKDIPQTKKHSPIPGKFAHGDPVLECVGDATYLIPNTWGVGKELDIAPPTPTCRRSSASNRTCRALRQRCLTR